MENVILIYLAKKNNTNLLEKVLRDNNNIDLNTTDFNGNTALIWAAKNNNFLMCKSLINAGADWCILNKKGRNFLDYLGSKKQLIINSYPDKYKNFLNKINSKK